MPKNPPEIKLISLKDLEILDPEIHKQLVEFYSSLDKKEYPEATIINLKNSKFI